VPRSRPITETAAGRHGPITETGVRGEGAADGVSWETWSLAAVAGGCWSVVAIVWAFLVSGWPGGPPLESGTETDRASASLPAG